MSSKRSPWYRTGLGPRSWRRSMVFRQHDDRSAELVQGEDDYLLDVRLPKRLVDGKRRGACLSVGRKIRVRIGTHVAGVARDEMSWLVDHRALAGIGAVGSVLRALLTAGDPRVLQRLWVGLITAAVALLRIDEDQRRIRAVVHFGLELLTPEVLPLCPLAFS